MLTSFTRGKNTTISKKCHAAKERNISSHFGISTHHNGTTFRYKTAGMEIIGYSVVRNKSKWCRTSKTLGMVV